MISTSSTESVERGFIALISILLVGALALIISLGVSFSALSGFDAALAEESSYAARITAESCIEYALLQLKNDPNYLGGERVHVESLMCTIEPITDAVDGSKEIFASAAVSTYQKRIFASATTSPIFKIQTWAEVE